MKRLIRKAEEIQNQEEDVKITTPQQDEQVPENSETGLPTVDVEMIQRLRNEVRQDLTNINTTNMVLLDQLDEADVRHDKCPRCKYQPMKRKEGFKICPSCGMIFKILDGKGYAIVG